MKSFITISFPKGTGMKSISMPRTEKLDIRIERGQSYIIFEQNNKFHIIEDIKLISMNTTDSVCNTTKYQELIFEGYYKKNKQEVFVPCEIKYKIYDHNMEI